MKRDLDLVRKILMACEADPTGYAPHPLEVEGYTQDQIGFHVYLMIQAGLLNGGDVTHMGASSPLGLAQSITWSGYEFLEASKDETRWTKAKRVASSAGAMTLEGVKSILSDLATAAAKSAMGLP